MSERVIFLDIDGPMIPLPAFFIDIEASMQRRVMSNMAVACLNRLCKVSGAKIVTNTMHNYVSVEGDMNVKDSLIFHGIDECHFHKNWRTTFPVDPLTNKNVRRIDGVHTWLEENGDVDWICFDDDYFTTDERLIVVHYTYGITYSEYLKATKFWDIEDKAELIW